MDRKATGLELQSRKGIRMIVKAIKEDDGNHPNEDQLNRGEEDQHSDQEQRDYQTNTIRQQQQQEEEQHIEERPHISQQDASD